MWPVPGEALSRTVRCEAALAELWGAALARWAPAVRAAVLPAAPVRQVLTASGPSLTSGNVLPPDPGAVPQTSQAWRDSAVVLSAGVAALWCVEWWEAAAALGVELPAAVAEAWSGAGERGPALDAAVARIIAANTELTVREVAARVSAVSADPALSASAVEFTAAMTTEAVETTPQRFAVKLTASLDGDGLPDDPAARAAVLRTRAADALAVDSPLMRDYANAQSFDAAAVQNNAVVHAARYSDGPLDKTWIATLDGKTRPTHWAADGQRVALDGRFTVGRSHMDHPGDRSAPPAEWKNCRCRVGVLAPDEAIPDEVDRHTERLDGRDSVAINRDGRSQAEEIARRAADGNVRAREDPEGIGVVAAAPAETTMTAADRQEYDMTDGPELFRTFTDQAVAPIGVPTSDRRMLAADIDLSFRSFPLPLMWKKQTGPGHDDAYTVGVIESGRVEGDRVLVSGYLLNTAEADEAAEQNAHGVSQPSVDLADAEIIATDADGNELTEEQFWDAWENGTPVYETARAGEFIGTTLVATPAFDTRFVLNTEREPRDVALVAAATAVLPQRVYPAALFADPQLTEPTPTTVDPDTGRIYGHMALWDAYHRGVGLEHVRPPHSPSGYAQFHTSPPLLLDDGRRLPVGRLTVGIGHAGLSLSGGPAMAHYDDARTCFALVRAGEDQHGIWFSGVAAPWATPDKVEQGVSSPLSGDWRDFGLGRDLVAALAVNTPGFAVRSRTDDYGRPVALVASAGPLLRRGHRPGGGLSKAVVKAAVAEALAEARRAEQLAALVDRSRAVVADPPTPAEQAAALFARCGDV